MMRCSVKEVTMVAFLIFFTGSCNYVFAGEWQKPWSSVEAAAAQRCEKTFEAYQLQSVCMENEKDGYDKLQGDFGMPRTVANKAKERCAKTFQPFQLQAVCMENEKAGYDKMNTYKGKGNDTVKETAEESRYDFVKPIWKRFATNSEPPYDYYEYDSAQKNILQGSVGQYREHTVSAMTRHMQEDTELGMFNIAINCTKQMAMVTDVRIFQIIKDMGPITENSVEYLSLQRYIR